MDEFKLEDVKCKIVAVWFAKSIHQCVSICFSEFERQVNINIGKICPAKINSPIGFKISANFSKKLSSFVI